MFSLLEVKNFPFLSGVLSQLKRSLTDLRTHAMGQKSASHDDDEYSQSGN